MYYIIQIYSKVNKIPVLLNKISSFFGYLFYFIKNICVRIFKRCHSYWNDSYLFVIVFVTVTWYFVCLVNFKFGPLSIWPFVSLALCQFGHLSVWPFVSLAICQFGPLSLFWEWLIFLALCQFGPLSVWPFVSYTLKTHPGRQNIRLHTFQQLCFCFHRNVLYSLPHNIENKIVHSKFSKIKNSYSSKSKKSRIL